MQRLFSLSSGEASPGDYAAIACQSMGNQGACAFGTAEKKIHNSSAASKNSPWIEVMASKERKQTDGVGIGWWQYHTAEAEFFPPSTRPSTSADHPTPWLRICPHERSGPPALPRGPLLVLLRRSSPVVISPSPRIPPLRIRNSPDGHSLRRAQRHRLVFGCTLDALPSMSTLTPNCLINSTSECSAIRATSSSQKR